jgi:hypothetical protein
LIDALSDTVDLIQVTSFVHPGKVPGMADAEAVVAGMTMREGVRYAGLWLNQRGLERAIATGRLDLEGKLTLYASDMFLKRNQNRTASSSARPARTDRHVSGPWHSGPDRLCHRRLWVQFRRRRRSCARGQPRGRHARDRAGLRRKTEI